MIISIRHILWKNLHFGNRTRFIVALRPKQNILHLVQLYTVLILSISTTIAQAQISEYEAKALYIEKFSRFIEWPESSSYQNFRIQIIGNSELARYLQNYHIIENNRIKNKPVTIEVIEHYYEISDCNILFIANNNEETLLSILSEIQGRPILSICEKHEWSDKGVHITFFTNANKLRFDINQTAARKSDIKIDALLLDYASQIR